jgi:hypothetical protein
MTSVPKDPPGLIELTFCPRCGRDDRVRQLKANHWATGMGEKCTGQLVTLHYHLNREVTPSAEESATLWDEGYYRGREDAALLHATPRKLEHTLPAPHRNPYR